MRLFLALVVVAVCSADVSAGPIREWVRQHRAGPCASPRAVASVSVASACAGGFATASVGVTAAVGVATGTALDEVNTKRAARGLAPFVHDPLLTEAAARCAAFRAAHGLFGHTSNDFAFVPAGSSASSAGCAAYPASYGWLSCCTYDGYTYGGAAFVVGRDGRRYMSLFVR